jgi:hypothetical protein
MNICRFLLIELVTGFSIWPQILYSKHWKVLEQLLNSCYINGRPADFWHEYAHSIYQRDSDDAVVDLQLYYMHGLQKFSVNILIHEF